jgi:hypothetical protein
MSVEFFKEVTGRDGSKDVDTNKRYRRTFIVRTSVPQDGASVVLSHPEIPVFNDVYSYLDDSDPSDPVPIEDTAAVAVDIRATQDNPNDPQDWRVTVDYAGVEDPVSQPAEVEYSPTRYQKAIIKDVNGAFVVNKAGDPFEGGIIVDRTRFTLTIVKAVDTWDPVVALAYQESLNQKEFLAAVHPQGFAPGTCKLTWGAKRMRRAGTTSFYWLRTAVIDIDKEGWKVKVRNAGMREYDAVANKMKDICIGGIVATTPQLLDDHGALLPIDEDPTECQFDGYLTMDWTSLGLEYTA